mmetsp:Transcript_22416/g.38330  ORF Transcript_22416/g.38330 Transcript_22416/m.38330 type:complete len:234 (-) Transcript_22416:52-753(-)
MLGSPFLPISSDWYNGARPIKDKRDWEKPESHDFHSLMDDIRNIRDVMEHAQKAPTELLVGKRSSSKRHDIVADCSASFASTSQLSGSTIPVVVEGFLLFYDKTLCDMLDVRMWLEADREQCLLRRFNRTLRKKPKQNLDDFTKFYQNVVWSHFLRYRETQVSNASDAKLLNGNGMTDEIAEQALAYCRDVAVDAEGSEGCNLRATEKHGSESEQTLPSASSSQESKQRRWGR